MQRETSRLGRLFVLLTLPLLAAGAAVAGGAGRDAALFSVAAYEKHIRFLASDDLKGRGIGTTQIDEAGRYIAAQFEELGVEPAGTDGFFQPFTVSISSRIADNTRLVIRSGEARKKSRLALSKDFIPFPFSARGGFDGEIVFVGYGIDESADRQYNDYDGIEVKDKVALMFRYEPAWWSEQKVDEQENTQAAPRHTRHAYFQTKAEHALKRGAKAVLIVNPVPSEGEKADTLYDFGSGRMPQVGLPMLQITRVAANKLLKAGGLPKIEELQKDIEDARRPQSAELRGVSVNGYVAVAKVETACKNVVGLIRGKGALADEYVVIGAHYDHLGVAANWRKPNDTNKYIHNGADDNASGTTGLLMVAQALRAGPPLKRSVLLMAFSAEESGLLGSKHWVEHPTVAIDEVVAMLNMDMIGRLKDDRLQVGGMGTGTGFKEMVKRLAEPYDFQIRNGGGGRGPSDHSSFYGAKVPVLFFFTGMHKQYHAPDDDADLIDFSGGCRVAKLAMDCLVEIANAKARPEFQRDVTRFRPDQQDGPAEVAKADKGEDTAKPAAASDEKAPKKGEKVASGKGDKASSSKKPPAPVHGSGDEGENERPAMPRARLGIAPGNYGEAEGRGFPIEYVVEGGPAQRAGIKDGDRILKIDGKEITDVYSYMNTISKHKPGDVIEILILRDEKELTFKVKLEGAPARGAE